MFNQINIKTTRAALPPWVDNSGLENIFLVIPGQQKDSHTSFVLTMKSKFLYAPDEGLNSVRKRSSKRA